MRRFSTVSRHLQKSKCMEIAFLQQMSTPLTNNIRLSSDIKDATGSLSADSNKNNWKNASTESTTMGTTQAMKLLMNAVRRRQFSYAEKLFERVPKLSQRPAAMRLLIKMYCEQLDFTTARAVLFATLNKVGEEGAARYIVHVTYNSQNSADIEEVTNRVCKEFGRVSPWFAATALYGLRFLGDLEAFDRVWTMVSKFWEPSLKPPTLHAKVLDSLLEEKWEMATKLWGISQGMSNLDPDIPKLRIWYMALRYFLVESPDIESVDRILLIMKKLELQVSTGISALLLRHLAPLFPAMSAIQWVQYARERNWPLDGTVIENIIFYCQGGLTSRFGHRIGHEIQQYAIKELTSRGIGVGKHRIGEGARFRKDKSEIQQAQSSGEVINVLRSMLKRGMRIPYDYFVHSFQKVAHFNDENDLREIVTMLRSHTYPLHCAGTDLSMVELHCRELKHEKHACQRILGEYLVQYPMVSHDLPQLTRMAILMTNCSAYLEAAAIVDSLRVEQQQNAKFSCANHDSASLQVLAAAKFKMREPLTPLLRGIISDSPNIYFDSRFMRKVRRMLFLANEETDVLDELEKLSMKTVADTYKEIDNVISLVAEA